MSGIFSSLITQLNSSIFILLALLVLFVVGVWIVASKLGGWAEKFKHQDERMGAVENIKETVVELRTKVDLIYQMVNPNSTVRSRSPLSLTPIGEEIAEKINAGKIFERIVTKLCNAVEEGNSKNAYDIQELAMSIAKNKIIALLNEDELKVIKQEAYDRGAILEDILAIFGILLRNHILQEKGLPISDVDKHEKGKK